MATAAAQAAPSTTGLAHALTRSEQVEMAFSELGTAAVGTVLLWGGCVWLPLLGPVAWAVVGLFAFWRFMGMRRLRAVGVLGAGHLPYPVPHGVGLSMIEVALAVPTVLITAAASVGIWPSALSPVATVLQMVLIVVTAGQLCISALLASAVARRESVPSLRVAAQAAMLLAPIGALVVIPVLIQWLVGSGALTGKTASSLINSMTAIMLGLGAAGIAASLALRYAMHGLSSVVPSGVDSPKAPARGPAPLPAPSPPAWAGDPDEPIPLVGDEPVDRRGADGG
jgi:hypothetical protein